MQNLSPCLWFATQALEAAEFYVGIFPFSRVMETVRQQDGSGGPGDVLTVRFELDGREFMALNGGVGLAFNPAISFLACTDDQYEIDRLWQQLGEGGQTRTRGWLTDRYGISWQVLPRALVRMLSSPDRVAVARLGRVMQSMGKLELDPLIRAFHGEELVSPEERRA
jgi:predicted 3-demethylubiquinone-9 3-methyltransferase (glyoxalase superfamily)